MAWTRGPLIGRGSTATVSAATSLSSGQLFAVKSAELPLSTFLQKEQHFLSKLNSPYIVKYIGFDVTFEPNPMYNIFLELAAHGTIHDVIRSHGGRLDESMIRAFTVSILKGLDYLHDHGVVHCDIKSQNVLVSKNGGAKIADFGCAKFAEGNNADSAFSGTPAFMAPEVARGEEQGFAADVWAVGCTVIEMASGNQPWKAELNDPVSALFRIGFSDDVPEIPGWLSETTKDFVKKCLTKNPRERWTVKELLDHGFLHESNDQYSSELCGFKLNYSPSCVLDNKIWDSMDGVESPLNLTQEFSGGFLNSPAERMKRLIGTDSDEANWSSEEDWITVRGTDAEEINNDSEENGDMVEEEEDFGGTESVVYDEEIDGSNSDSLGNNFVSKLGFEKDNENSFDPISVLLFCLLLSSSSQSFFIFFLSSCQNKILPVDNLILFLCGRDLVMCFLNTLLLNFETKYNDTD